MELRVDGQPVPQGSKNAFPYKRKDGSIGVAVSDKNSSGLKEWRGAIAAAARVWIALNGNPAPLDEPVSITVTFYLPRPASAPKRVMKPHKGLDVDKLVRAAFDALTKLAYFDDSRVTTLVARKRFAVDRPPGIELSLEPDHTT